MVSRALGEHAKEVASVARRINEIGGPVRDLEYDAHYNGRNQQLADAVTSAQELTKLAGAALDRKLTLAQARDVFEAGGLPFLKAEEVKGAAFLAAMVGDVPLTVPQAPPFDPKLEIPLPKRKGAYTLEEAKQVVTKRFGGVRAAMSEMSVSNITHALVQRGNELGRVDLGGLLDRLFNGDPAAQVTPAALRFQNLPGDPYASADDPLAKGGVLLTTAERAAATAIYAALFVPEREVHLQAPSPLRTPLAQLGGATVLMETRTSFQVGNEGECVYASTRHSVVVKAPPGTMVLFGEGLQATLNTAYEVPKTGELELPNRNRKPFAARVLGSDPSGLLSPTLVGSFAIQLPPDERRILKD
jgi:hypothetical protein